MIDWDHLPDPLPPEGIDIEVRATFSGLRFLPSLLASGKNNRSPLLRLHHDRLEVKVMKTAVVPYQRIRLADGRVLGKTHNLTITIDGSLSRPTANIRSREDLVGAVRFLSDRGVSLSSRAQRLLG